MKVAIMGTSFEHDITKIHRLLDRYFQYIPVDKILLTNTSEGIDRIVMLYALKKHIPYDVCTGFRDIVREADMLIAFPCGEDESTRMWIDDFILADKRIIRHELLKQYIEYEDGMNVYMMYHHNGCKTGFRIMGKYWKNGYAVVTRVGCAKEGKRINWQDLNLPDKSVMVDFYNLDDEKTGSGLLRNPESLDYYMLKSRTVKDSFFR